MMCNFLMFAASDRLLNVLKPTLFAKLPSKFVWYMFSISLTLSLLIALPFLLMSQIFNDKGKLNCWISAENSYILFYEALFTNIAPVQLTLAFACNFFFHKRMLKQGRVDNVIKGSQQIDKEQFRVSKFLVVISFTFTLFSIPQTTFYLMNTAITIGLVDGNAELFRTLMDIIWTVYLSRSVVDSVVCSIYFKPLRNVHVTAFKNLVGLIKRS
uniref:G-protein coupled receptors family 1 profile domain-containing protein n=1 Tax=Trichobilharzia regenti TaxID=157069 RepID=A0AA85JF08_TRIRE|nr:unnamed protein product [Trichobilharzia regenti]